MTTDTSSLWITYAWIDDDEGDFSYLVTELAGVGVRARYDKIALVPGRRLWEQIAEEIIGGSHSAWAYLLTRNSIASQACHEELAYALDRALNQKGSRFPLIGLLHGIEIDQVPPALKIRLCVNLASTSWREGVKAGVEGRTSSLPPEPVSTYVWNVRDSGPARIAVAVRPRFGEVMFWRLAVPKDPVVSQWGFGPAGGGGLSSTMTMVIEGEGQLNGEEMQWFGSGDRLSPGVSAQLMLEGRPAWVAFGVAADAFGLPTKWEIMRLQ